ncbi:MAG: hypothetical protein ACO34E_13305 [Limisphaerales bacterium]
MKILCAWCNKTIRGRGVGMSHGICPPCFQDYFQEQFAFVDLVKVEVSERGGRRRRAVGRSSCGGVESGRLVQQNLFV